MACSRILCPDVACVASKNGTVGYNNGRGSDEWCVSEIVVNPCALKAWAFRRMVPTGRCRHQLSKIPGPHGAPAVYVFQNTPLQSAIWVSAPQRGLRCVFASHYALKEWDSHQVLTTMPIVTLNVHYSISTSKAAMAQAFLANHPWEHVRSMATSIGIEGSSTVLEA